MNLSFLRLPYILSGCAAFFATLTYFVLIHNISTGGIYTHFVSLLISCDLVILALLASVIGRRIAALLSERKLGLKGSKLHLQLVALFSFISIIPVIIVALFSGHFLNVGVNAWFAEPVRNALQQANVLAASYLNEHKKAITIDAFSLAEQIRPEINYYMEHPQELEDRLNAEAEGRRLAEAMVIKQDGKDFRVLARSFFTFLPLLEDLTSILKTTQDYAFMETPSCVRAVIKLDPVSNTYLFIGKNIDPVVLQHVDKTYLALKDYRLSADRHVDIQINFIMFFAIVALLLLMAAIWVGLTIADMMAKPVTQLIKAAQAVSEGDLSTKLKVDKVNNEIDDLCQSFNRMTYQLAQQKHDLIASQKKAAWADMARKIAHEIKNPLTPIQLSAERLKRKYIHAIQDDPLTFQQCVDTIIRQVGVIGSLVTEFSNFARMPEPAPEYVDIVSLAKEAFLLQKNAYPHILFLFEAQPAVIMHGVDPLQMNQVFTNLLQNAINAVIEHTHTKFIIKMSLSLDTENLYIKVEDNGPGFPKINLEKLVEPYFTTRQKGTGLGLAIVSKIVSDHNGSMLLSSSPDLNGACVMLTFLLKKKD